MGKEIGVANRNITAKFNSLVTCPPGGSFRDHPHTGEGPGLIGPLVVQLASLFGGCEFFLRNVDGEHVLDFAKEATVLFHAAALYADG